MLFYNVYMFVFHNDEYGRNVVHMIKSFAYIRIFSEIVPDNVLAHSFKNTQYSVPNTSIIQVESLLPTVFLKTRICTTLFLEW